MNYATFLQMTSDSTYNYFDSMPLPFIMNNMGNIGSIWTMPQNNWNFGTGFDIFGGFNAFGGFNSFGGFNAFSAFNCGWGGSTGISSFSNKEKDPHKGIRSLLIKIKNCKEIELTDDEKEKINNALNAKGAEEEKNAALVSAYNSLSPAYIKKVMRIQYSSNLSALGNKKADENLRKSIEQSHQNLSEGKAAEAAKTMSRNIVKNLSVWNDRYTNESMFNILASHISSDEGTKTTQKDGMKQIADALIKEAESLTEKYNMPKLSVAVAKLNSAISKAYNDFSSANVKAVTEPFNRLYAMCRIIKSQMLDKQIQNDYGYICNVADDKHKVFDNIAYNDVIEDLKREGISIPQVIDSVPDVIGEKTLTNDLKQAKNAADKLITLEEAGKIKEIGNLGVYATTTDGTAANVHYYAIVNIDGEEILRELVNVQSIDSKGNCKMKDGTTKTLNMVKNDTANREVNPSDIREMREKEIKAINDIEGLIKEGILVKSDCKNPSQVYFMVMKTKNENGYYQTHYIIENGDIKELKAVGYIASDGSWNTSKSNYNKDPHRYEPEKVAINTSDIRAKIDRQNDLAKADVQKLISDGILMESSCKKPMVYCTTKAINGNHVHYVIEGGIIKKLENVRYVDANGNGKLNNGISITVAKAKRVDTNEETIRKAYNG